MQPLLSIVVLVYNTAEYLQECFDSLLNQRYENIEIIAIDDGSTDESFAICQAYAARHPRFRCLTKPNEGGAVVGNLGISMARGEYVALVDSDDVVTADGYALLMAEALAQRADIVVGRAARLTDGVVNSVSFLYEPFVWNRRRVLESVAEFPDLMHDGFYWNKVFRLEFLREHGLGMVPGLLYADRPFVHKAYYLSRKTAIITDLVYLWRTRAAGAALSITQNKAALSNFQDRIRSMTIEWMDFEQVEGADWYRRLIAETNLQRALHVVYSIVDSPSFRAVYLEGMQRILALYGDLDHRPLGARRSVYLELLKQGEVAGLCFLLGLQNEGKTLEIEGKCYWKQPFLSSQEVVVPRELARIDFPTIGFFHISRLARVGETLELELNIHDAVMAGTEVVFEMQSLLGDDVITFEDRGRLRPHVYAYRMTLPADFMTRRASGDLFGLILNYRCGDITGRYRIGRALMTEQVLQAMPVTGPSEYPVCYSPEFGGVGMRVV
ncbi:glycosyltransferase [Pseudomonas sp. LFM046]|uniref:glycosyltransferase n=1 Tax=Pseudomonas sp. LFM046 TaxID=1608357 RepID=UPI0005CFB63C|nr:glycosyltransferase [Pseudomonas sp. LFM046]